MYTNSTKQLITSSNYQNVSSISHEQLCSMTSCLSDFFPGGLAGFTYPNHELLFMTEGAARLLGVSLVSLTPNSAVSLPTETIRESSSGLIDECRRQFRDKGQFHVSFSIYRDKQVIHIRLDGGSAHNARWGQYILCVFSNMTKPFCEYAELHSANRRDELTGLYDKRSIEELCSSYLKWEGPDQKHALLFIDMDNFKLADITLGRDITDKILKSLGELLTCAFRSDDLIGRINDDEFIVLMKNVPDQQIVKKRAVEICRMVSRLFMEFEFPPGSCSIGITFGHLGALTFKENMSNADLALYHCKEGGKNNWSICEHIDSTGVTVISAFGDAGRGSDLGD